MKKFLLGTVGLVALGMASAPASAADLAARPVYKAPPMVQTVYDWSGFYIGINGGWAQTNDRRIDAGGALFGDYDLNGGTVGGQLGYRWQAGPWVFGLEAQGNWADINGSTANLLAPGGALIRSKMDAFGLFTGQIGYAWNNVLLYAKGGAAVTDRNFEFVGAGGGCSPQPVTTPAGARPWVPASNSASRPIGRSASNTTTSSRIVTTRRSSLRAASSFPALAWAATPTWFSVV